MRPITPRLAGACVLWRRKDSEMEVLVITRGKNLKFLPGQHAFPGGSVEQSDGLSLTEQIVDKKINSALTAAIRETFEESGALPFALKNKEEVRKLWKALNKREISFCELQKQWNLKLDVNNLYCSGPWITPPGLPQRFETYFFFIEWKSEYCELDQVRSEEVESKRWETPRNLLLQWHKGEISLSTPVAFILEHLKAFSIPKVFEYLNPIPWSDNDYHYFHPRSGIHIIPLPCPEETFFNKVNAVLVGSEEIMIIDPGSDDSESMKVLTKWIEHFINLGSQIKGVCFTHSHMDHAGAVNEVAKHFDIPVLVPADLGIVELEEKCKVEYISNEVMLTDQDLPWKVVPYFTPGHKDKHVSYYETTTRTLVAGDMISSEGPVLIDPDDGGSMSTYMESLERLSCLDIDLLIPGHGIPWFFVSGNELIQKVIQHRKMREAKIIKKIEEGISSIDELLIRVYDDIPPERLTMARQQLIAHLLDLQTRGVVKNIIIQEN